MDNLQQGYEEKMSNEIENYRRKLIGLEEKVRKSKSEIQIKQNLKLKEPFSAESEEEISYLKDWIKFYEEKITRLKHKVELLEKETPHDYEKAEVKIEEKHEVKEEEIKEQIKELFEEKKETKKLDFKRISETIKKPIENIFEKAKAFKRQKILLYLTSALIILLMVSILFISKPKITGYVTLIQEKTYDDRLNLLVNESADFNWTLRNPSSIKSLKATGSITGNGTVKIYIEKNGSRYLVYKNK